MRRYLLFLATSLLLAALAVSAIAAVIDRGHPKGGRPPVKRAKIPPTVPYKGSPSAAGPQRIRLAVRPKTAVAGRTTRFRFRVTTSFGAPFRKTPIVFAGKRATSNLYGQATIRVKLRSARRYTASAVQAGVTTTATARVRARRASR
jgi:hypothetical protein